MKIIFFITLFINLLFSITLTPFYVTIDNKKENNVIFTVSNATKEPVPVNISVLELVSNNDKKETRVATQKVKFYPEQFILNPKEIKNIRLRYQGSKLPESEEVFRVIAKELNINVSDEINNTKATTVNAKIITKFTYEALLFVRQPTAKEKLEVGLTKTSQGLDLTITNSGTASVIPQFSAYNFIVTTTDNKEHTLVEDDLKGTNIKRVLAGKTNLFSLNNINSISLNKIKDIRLERKFK